MANLIEKLFMRGRDSKDIKRGEYGVLAGTVGILCNLLLCGFKMAIGLLSGSISIIADAVNNLSDTASSAVTLLGFKMSQKPADKEHPFGHARIEYMSGAFISIVIIVVGFELLRSSIQRIINPAPVEFSIVTFIVLITSIAAKLWLRYFYISVSKRINSNTLKVAANDSRNDIIATAVVIVAAGINYFFGISLDGYFGAALSLFIMISGFLSIRDAMNPLLGEAPSKELVANIYSNIMGFDGILGLHDLIVHSYGPGKHFATVHAEMDSRVDPLISHGIIDNLEREVGERLGVKLVVHYDPLDPPSEESVALEKKVTELVQNIDKSLSIHDLRIIKAHDHTNVVFDIAVPPEYKGKISDLKNWISAGIKMMPGNYYPVIQIDQNYTALNR